MVLVIVCAVLAAGCAADKLLERIPAAERFVRSLPLGRGDEL